MKTDGQEVTSLIPSQFKESNLKYRVKHKITGLQQSLPLTGELLVNWVHNRVFFHFEQEPNQKLKFNVLFYELQNQIYAHF